MLFTLQLQSDSAAAVLLLFTSHSDCRVISLLLFTSHSDCRVISHRLCDLLEKDKERFYSILFHSEF